ncbi:DUF2510 domain-containing protein [Mycolicibacterium sp. Dal123E01]|uniref:DUF2510 domain-containing protein n=1 Tax=Mycolicibacterium sp. Dal123E01 TaxID=3457578 RepID=UPI00403E9399
MADLSQPAVPPGWYRDPWAASGQRYWDGRQWTPAARPTPSKRIAWLWVIVAVVAIPVLFFGGCAAVIEFGSRNAHNHPDGSYELVRDQGPGL